MPSTLIRRTTRNASKATGIKSIDAKVTKKAIKPKTPIEVEDDIETLKYFPQTASERKAFVNPKTSRPITDFQYAVYDVCAQVPKGQVTSYKAIGDFLGSGPRAVGQALRVNPFMPLPVPCHRVITSGLTIGGFSGATGDSQLVCNKRSKLTREGCLFDGDEFIANSDGKRKLFEEFIKGGI